VLSGLELINYIIIKRKAKKLKADGPSPNLCRLFKHNHFKLVLVACPCPFNSEDILHSQSNKKFGGFFRGVYVWGLSSKLLGKNTQFTRIYFLKTHRSAVT
jgi:hypothetical protein